ncbi:HAMP domain-containing sensor histidine kinase [uncultured Parabacteroides sp.]|uniref:sensor histidine kinase n=1 Tax=uncultured Parabacteroides sp. TaxID=512312 RepID=UPI0025E89CE6|nr:HAMP domain-containing sensor histidine kinase [uncultured Parabacteroides sp.]
MKENQTLHIYFLICILLILTGTSCNDSGVKRRILVIHSYEAEYAGYKHNGEKIRQQFHRQKIHADIRTFYLDCDSYREKDELNRMYNFLDTTANWKPEIILVYDDQATYSLMACEHPLVKQTPVVFAGVNYPNWKLLKQYPNVTGFWDKPEFMKTVELIETLFGHMRIHFWLDNTYLGRQTMEQFISEIGPLRMKEYAPSLNVINENGVFHVQRDTIQHNNQLFTNSSILPAKPAHTIFNFINSRETSSNNLLWVLSGLHRHSVFVQSKRDFTSKRLGLFASSPTFTVINEGFGVGEGLTGGYLTSTEDEIKISVDRAIELLRGKAISDTPITQSPKQFVLDWIEMQRWHISRKNLPAPYQIINMPLTERYKTLFITLGILLLLIVTTVILSLLRLYRKENRTKKETQKSLRKSERFLSLALSGGKVFAYQLKDYTFYFDNEFYTNAGLDQKPILINEYLDHLHPGDIQVFKKDIQRAYSGEIIENISQIRCDFDGKGYQWWEFRYTYNKEDDAFNGLCLNIQQKKKAEQELIEARQKAEESDKMKSTFLANMSHEIRTPLNAIVGFSNLIACNDMELDTEEKEEFVRLINTNCDLLLKLISDILDLSRIESGRMEFTFTRQNLTTLINDIYHTHQLLLPPEVKLIQETPETPIFIETDRHRLTQVITNFINNAVKFTQKGYIKLSYKYNEEDSSVHITIEDTGIGIPKEKQKAIFERFNKLDEFAQGTGLGLSICQVIVKRLEGHITLQSEERKGSRFTVCLPLINHQH